MSVEPRGYLLELIRAREPGIDETRAEAVAAEWNQAFGNGLPLLADLARQALAVQERNRAEEAMHFFRAQLYHAGPQSRITQVIETFPEIEKLICEAGLGSAAEWKKPTGRQAEAFRKLAELDPVMV